MTSVASALNTFGWDFQPGKTAETTRFPGVEQGGPGDNVNKGRRFRLLNEHTLMNILGVIPVVSIAVGILRIISATAQAKQYDQEQKSFITAEIVRGAFEIACLGILFLPFDLIGSIIREASR